MIAEKIPREDSERRFREKIPREDSEKDGMSTPQRIRVICSGVMFRCEMGNTSVWPSLGGFRPMGVCARLLFVLLAPP